MKTLQNKVKTAAVTVLALALVVAPAAGFAKENGLGKQEKKDKSCLKAFGHLVAPGWIKANGKLSVSEDCRLPFGIFKKLNNGNVTTTPDVTIPIISSLSVKVDGTKAKVSWNTNEKTIGAVFYGTTTPIVTHSSATSTNGGLLLGATSTNSVRLFDSSFSKDHRLQISGLSVSTTYYVVVASRDAAGNVSISGSSSFTTNTSGDTSSPVISNIVTTVGSSSLKVMWKTNEPATSKIFYGTSTINTVSSLQISSSSLKTDHSLMVSGLATGTMYHLVTQSADASGNVTTSADFTASTSI